jgi:phospholipid N-methyltransferase
MPSRREIMSYIKRFAVTGSVCPSTPIFGQRAAAEVARLAPQYDRVVVAGIGSGVVASRIHKRCPRAIFVECEAHFSEQFAARHPDALVVTDYIQYLYDHHADLRNQRVLLASFVPTAGTFYSDEIVRFFVSVCRSGGSVMQMRYLPHQMSSRFFDGMRARGIVSKRLFTVAMNFPPVSMYGLRSVLAPVAGSGVPIAAARQSPMRHQIAAKSGSAQASRASDAAA